MLRNSGDMLPLSFQMILQNCRALAGDSYWQVEGLDDEDLEASLRAAAFVFRGGELMKYQKSGRGKPHKRVFRVASGPSGKIHLAWDTRKEDIVRADANVYASCFQGDRPPDAAGSFQLILALRMLFVVAESAAERDNWVVGINAVVGNGVRRVHRDDEPKNFEVGSVGRDGSAWVAVQDERTGSVHMRDFGASGAELWLKSTRSVRAGARRHSQSGPAADAAASAVRRSSVGRNTGTGAGRVGAVLPPPLPPTLQGHHTQADLLAEQAAAEFDERAAEEGRQREAAAARAVAEAEERARHFRELQATVDEEELRRHDMAERQRRLVQQEAAAEQAQREAVRASQAEAEAAEASYNAAVQKAEREAEEAAEREAEATAAVQEALLTQDPETLRAALHHFGATLASGTDQAAADLHVATEYLRQLDEASANYAAECAALAAELEAASLVSTDHLGAEQALARLTEVAARAADAATPEQMGAAQAKVNELHALVVELHGARVQADQTLYEAARQAQTHGVAACDGLRAAIAHAAALQHESEMVVAARATLEALEADAAEREVEFDAAAVELDASVRAAAEALAFAVSNGLVLRDFSAAHALRAAMGRAAAAGVDQARIHEAGHQLAPLEVAERSHLDEVRAATQKLSAALAASSEAALRKTTTDDRHLADFIDAALWTSANEKLEKLSTERELAESTAELAAAMETAEGAAGAAPLRAAFERAQSAGAQGLAMRRAEKKLKDLTELAEAAEREAEALAWMERQAAAKSAQDAENRREEEEKERKKAEKKAAKEAERAERRKTRGESMASGDDLLSRAVAAQSWEELTSDDGKAYYHNMATGEVTWELPDEMRQSKPATREASSSVWDTESSARSESIAAPVTDMRDMSAALSAAMPKPAAPAAADNGPELGSMSTKELKRYLRARDLAEEMESASTKPELLELAERARRKKLPVVTWQKTRAPDGRWYYVNAKTKETSWTKPEPEEE